MTLTLENAAQQAVFLHFTKLINDVFFLLFEYAIDNTDSIRESSAAFRLQHSWDILQYTIQIENQFTHFGAELNEYHDAYGNEQKRCNHTD